jgi:YbbR domain-containing protein
MIRNSPSGRAYRSVLVILAVLVLLAGAALLFFDKGEEVVLAIPVQFKNIPADMIPVVDSPPVLEVRLKGPSSVIQKTRDLQPACVVDLASVAPGPMLISVSTDMIKVPRRISIAEINPPSFSITIDRRLEKVVPVVPHLNQDPATGYVIARVTANPSTVTLSGPKTVLEGISAIRTTPIDVSGLTESTRKNVALDLNHHANLQPVEESLVEVEIVVEPKMDEKWMRLAVQATGGDKEYVITPDQIEILLQGPMDALKKLTEEDGVQAYVDLTGLEPGTYVRPVVIKPPVSITLVEAKPEVFTVKVLESNRSGDR